MSAIHTARLGDRGGFPTVLAHCFLGHSGGWTRLFDHLQTPLDAVAFDLPGHGRSDPWQGPPDEGGEGAGDLHSQATAILASLVERPSLLIGHSFGGTLALRYALENPGMVRAMVLIEPVLFGAARGTPEFERNMAAERPLHAAFARGDLAEAARIFFALNGDEAGWAAMPEAARDRMIAQMPMIGVGVPAIVEDNAGLLTPGRMEALKVPALVLAGASSPPISPAVARAVACRLGHAQFQRVDGAGHMAPITHPGTTAALIDTWLATIGLNARNLNASGPNAGSPNAGSPNAKPRVG